MKGENIRVNYETIDIVEQRELIEITRDLSEEEKKAIARKLVEIYKITQL